jgi:peptidylprolyl isomerase
MRLQKYIVATFTALAALSASQALAIDPGYRVLDAQNTLVIDTTKGRIVVEMYPSMAPSHAERLTTLARQEFYNGIIFHRVIEGFMAQTGDPTGTGEGSSQLPDLAGEFTVRHDANFPFVTVDRPAGALVGFVGAMPAQSQVNELMAFSKDQKVEAWGLYCQGTLGMARASGPDSANSQFFMMRAPTKVLEKKYTAFGRVVSGLEVVKKIKVGEPVVDPDKMLKVQVLADMPEAERPNIEIMDTRSEQFKQVVDQIKKDKGAGFQVCDITVPVKVIKP